LNTTPTNPWNTEPVFDEDPREDEDEPLFATVKSNSGVSKPITAPVSMPSQRTPMSTLTSALQQAGQGIFNQNANGSDIGNMTLTEGGRHGSDSMMLGTSYLEGGAQPISMQNRNRRESNTGSLVNGLSWQPGSLTSGSWVNE
jgi:hypothetical protein